MDTDYREVSDTILREYPNIRPKYLIISKQFFSPTGREYNTFLLQTTDGLLVAKGITKHTNSVSKLDTEWAALKILNGKNVPKLIFKDHRPEQYLLIEFLEGFGAADLLTENTKIEIVFNLIGDALGKIHGVPVNNFGSLVDIQPVIWSEYIKSKFSERMSGIKNLVDKDLFKKTISIFHNLEGLLERENHQPPVVIHRDAYSENFIIAKDFSKALMIDFAMAMGGRPLFDVAKFFTTELFRRPQYRDDFLNSYQRHIPLGTDFFQELTLYILLECAGFIAFNHATNNFSSRDSCITTLKETVGNFGVMKSLLE